MGGRGRCGGPEILCSPEDSRYCASLPHPPYHLSRTPTPNKNASLFSHALCFLQVLDFPVVTLVRFWSNHHLLDMLQRPLWRVVSGRSKQYVDKIVAGACVQGGCGCGVEGRESMMQ